MQSSVPADLPPWLAVLMGPLFLVAFAGLWLLVTVILAYSSGWVSLAKTFAAVDKPQGAKFSGASGTVGARNAPARYRNCLTVIVTGAGFHLSVWPLLRGFAAKDLFIPWAAIKEIEDRKQLWLSFQSIQLDSHPQLISLYGDAGQAVYEAYTSQCRR